jgi:hypothetical protein
MREMREIIIPDIQTMYPKKKKEFIDQNIEVFLQTISILLT